MPGRFGERMRLPLSRLSYLFRAQRRQSVARAAEVVGLRFLDAAATQRLFLRPIARGIYRVEPDGNTRVTRSGVVRAGNNFLTLDYDSVTGLRASSLFPTRKRRHLPAVLPLWSQTWPSYYHWLIDIAPRIAAAKLDLEDFSNIFFLYPGELNSVQRETLEALGVALSNVVNLHQSDPVSADTIYAMPLPGYRVIDPRIHALRTMLGKSGTPRRKLYLSRKGRRRVVNEADLYALLGRAGFEFITDDPRTLLEQIELFSEATHVVAPHGAAMSNIIWCSARSRVLELANARYSPDYFKNLSAECNLEYRRLIFGAGAAHWTRTEDDIVVDLEEVRRFISEEWRLQ